jgi:hypothetical protein
MSSSSINLLRLGTFRLPGFSEKVQVFLRLVHGTGGQSASIIKVFRDSGFPMQMLRPGSEA